jgi:hypothetical protein
LSQSGASSEQGLFQLLVKPTADDRRELDDESAAQFRYSMFLAAVRPITIDWRMPCLFAISLNLFVISLNLFVISLNFVLPSDIDQSSTHIAL